MASLILIAATALQLLMGGAFELVRVSPLGSYKLAHSVVRVIGSDRSTVAESRTDQFGRVKFEPPAGTYDAEAVDGKKTYRFQITIPSVDKLTRIQVK